MASSWYYYRDVEEHAATYFRHDITNTAIQLTYDFFFRLKGTHEIIFIHIIH